MSLRPWPKRHDRSPIFGGRRRQVRRRYEFEGLESRALLTTFYVAPTGSDGGSGAASSPFHSIQGAVNVANSGDEIRVAAGTYTYDAGADHYTNKLSYTDFLGASTVVGIVAKQLRILGGFTTSNWAVPDPASNPTIIDGQGSHRGIFVLGGGATNLDLEGFTIQNGVARGIAKRGGAEAAFAFGGGLFADRGDKGDTGQWVLRNDVFKNNMAVASGPLGDAGGRGAGGAIALRYVNNIVLDHVTFDGNQAVGSDGPSSGGGGLGGAIHVDHSNVTGNDVTFTDNLARSGNSGGSGRASDGESADALGGAVAVINGSQVTLTRVTATTNHALGGNASGVGGSGFGGAFYAEGGGSGQAAHLSLIDAFLEGNTVRGGDAATGGIAGGGAIQTHDATLTLDRSRVVANSAQSGGSTTGGAAGSSGGGGLFLTAFNVPVSNTINNSVIADNVVTTGVGGKTDEGGGGGAWFQGGTTSLTQVTIDNNHTASSLPTGQGVLVLTGGTVVNLANSIVSNHTGSATAGALDVQPGGQLNLNTILGANNTRIFSAFTKSGVSGANTILTPAGSPALYNSPGSPRWDYHLNRALPSNPAKDASVGSTATVDLDGNPRVGTPDLGAYEQITPRIEFLTPIEVSEGGKARIVIARRGDLSDTLTVLVSVVGGGSAASGTDYVPFGASGTVSVTFNPYDETKTVELTTIDNGAVNAAKTVNLALGLPPGSENLARLGNATQATVTILDNDGGPAPTSGFAVTDVQPLRNKKGITGVVIHFNAPLKVKTARKARAYALHKVSGKGRFPRIGRIVYKANSTTLTLKFTGPIRAGSSGTFLLNASRLSDATGRPLGGNTSFTLTA